MLLKGPNKDSDPQSFQADMEFEKMGNEKCMLEFFTHKPDEMYCIILLKSGTLRLNKCTLSLDGIFRETYRKVPCLTVLSKASIEMVDCKFKGDTTNDANTAGIVAINADVDIRNCTLHHFKSGGIMVQSKAQNRVNISGNKIISCETNGIYIQGKSSEPVIRDNEINFCRCAAITTNLDVKASLVNNKLNLNVVGIEVLNNNSHIIDNKIEKSHENGIKVTGTDKQHLCKPQIWRNQVKSCGYNGLVIIGD